MTIAGIIVLVLVLVLWVARLLLVPYARCWWCGGSGVNWFSGPRRHGDCWFCKGRKRRMVLGARTVRRIWNSWRMK